MSETELILAETPQVIAFLISKLGYKKVYAIFKKAVKNPVLCSLTDKTLNEGVTIEETARRLAKKLIKQ
ncbi:MAG: hypothetical protein IPJ03_15860 [Ignavibacteriales bacterium]|nr:hypothetical protein [Ignavibacteriales bacterium]